LISIIRPDLSAVWCIIIINNNKLLLSYNNKLLLSLIIVNIDVTRRRNFPAGRLDAMSLINARLATIVLTEVEVLHCPETVRDARHAESVPGVHVMRVLSQMTSAPAELQNSFARGQSSHRACIV